MKYFILLLLLTGAIGRSLAFNPDSLTSLYQTEKLRWPDSDKRFPTPLFTFYLGASLVFINGHNQLNDADNGGNRYNFQDDLNFPSYRLVPRINLFVKLSESNRLLFSIYNIQNSANTILRQDLQFGDLTFPANGEVHAKVRLRSALVGYNHVFMSRERGDLGFMIGLSGIHFQNEIYTRNQPEHIKKTNSNWLLLPSIGLASGMYVKRDIYIRGIIDYFSMGLKHYDFIIFNFKPTIEFYLYKNLGLAFRYHYSYNRISQIPWSNYQGEIKLHSHAFSVVVCYRMFKKKDRISYASNLPQKTIRTFSGI